MEILCEAIEVKKSEFNRDDKNAPGHYLSITIDDIGEPNLIPMDAFNEVIRSSLHEVGPITNQPIVASSSDSFALNIKTVSRSSSVIDFLLQYITITQKDFEKNNELVIKSTIPNFLELPWEQIVPLQIYVFRYFAGSEIRRVGTKEHSLLLLMSHAHKDIRDNQKKVMDEEVKEIYDALHFLTGDNQVSRFKLNKILLLKHTTKELLESVDCKQYDFAHFIMHGDPISGGLCLEGASNPDYKLPHILSVEDFIRLFKDCSFDLVVLSVCYSGGGIADKNSLAYAIVEAGIAQHVIAYRKGVREVFAKKFTKKFYAYLSNGDAVRKVYKDTLEAYYAMGMDNQAPFLYMRA